MRYLERDGVTRDGERGEAYSADRDVADGRAFLELGRKDRHQFRFIVSAENSVELDDLRQTTRDLMARMEVDLETKLDWIAVDHHNTGHPHSHILVRGITDDGKILNIAGDYIAHGVRERASDIVTLELGRQTDLEVTDELRREVEAERFTRLDRMLLAEQRALGGFADLRPDCDTLETMKRNRALLIGRAQALERMGLATRVDPGVWQISAGAETTLREMGERGDIVRSMHRALERNGLHGRRDTSQLALHRQTLRERIVGRVLDKQLAADELGERVQLVIDATDGRVHQIEVGIAAAEDVTPGMIVAAVPPPTAPRVADQNIAAATNDRGLYRPSEHLERVQAENRALDAERFVRMHVRRLEALRRAGIVERRDADTWLVPADLPERGLAYDRQRHGRGPRMEILSPMSVERQVSYDGATWLDRELVAEHRTPFREAGFGAEVTYAMERRKRVLIGFGAAVEQTPGDVRLPRNLIPWLEQREVQRVGQTIAAERGLRWRPVDTGDRLQGKLVGSTRLASGRFAMIDDGLGFSLVPWNDTLGRQLGREISGVGLPGGGIDWTFGRQRGLGI